jgi:hypothetical protein
MKRTTLVAAIALILSLGPGGLQASSCSSCRGRRGSDLSWQGMVVFLATVFPIL